MLNLIKEKWEKYRVKRDEKIRNTCLICGRATDMMNRVPFHCLDCGFSGSVHDSCRRGGLPSRPGVMTFGSAIQIRCPKCGATT